MICFNQFVLLYEKLIRREDGCLCIWIFCISVVWHKKFSAKAQNHSCEGNNIFKVFKTNECEKHFKETCTSDSFLKTMSPLYLYLCCSEFYITKKFDITWIFNIKAYYNFQRFYISYWIWRCYINSFCSDIEVAINYITGIRKLHIISRIFDISIHLIIVSNVTIS